MNVFLMCSSVLSCKSDFCSATLFKLQYDHALKTHALKTEAALGGAHFAFGHSKLATNALMKAWRIVDLHAPWCQSDVDARIRQCTVLARQRKVHLYAECWRHKPM